MSRVWAVARNLFLEFRRMRVLLALTLILILACTFGVAWWASSGTAWADQKIQTLLSYSLRFLTGFLAFLTIFLTTATVTRDIKRKELFTITTKPVSRGQYLLGKLLGISLLNLLLLVIAGGLVFFLAYHLRRTQPQTEAETRRVDELILTARRAVQPPLPDVSAEVASQVDALAAQEIREQNITDPRQIDIMRRVIEQQLASRFILQRRTVPPGRHIVWHFTGIEPRDTENGYVYLRYKQSVSTNPPDLNLYGQWIYGPRNPLEHAGSMHTTYDTIRTVHEFAIPASAVSPEGDLYVAYRNPVENSAAYPVSVIFPLESGIELLYRVGSFPLNFIKGLALIYFRLILLAVLCLALGAWLSYPVAVLCALTIFIFGLMSNFILDAVKWNAVDLHADIIRLVVYILPSYAAYDPIPLLEKGRLVSLQIFADIGRALTAVLQGQTPPEHLRQNILLFKDICLAFVIAFVGYLIFRFRELARVIV